ncbi:stage 0 sporulation protein [Patescibacteria group bacterium]|nr:stage 0 sporulation protein [Patescibacteria group bacterium]
MSKIAQIIFTPWDKPYDFSFEEFDLLVGDSVVVKTELGTEVGRVVSIIDAKKVDDKEREIKPISRKVTTADLNKVSDATKQKGPAIEYCRKATEKYGLGMKIVDCHFSFDGGRITFAFIADGRVDFRQLVKDLTHHFQKSIRLHQIGIRDEAKMSGDFGTCGRKLCCKGFLNELGNITSELAEQQQISHRGSDRLSGICGRLRCCLAYEKDLYDDLAKNLPAIGTVIKTKKGKGEVIGWHTLRQTVDLKLEGKDGNKGDIIEINPNE